MKRDYTLVSAQVATAVTRGAGGGGEIPGDGAYGPVAGQCQPRARHGGAGVGVTGGGGGRGGKDCRAIDTPSAALMLQYFSRPKNILEIVKGLRTVPEDVEVLINNDSGSDHAVWRSVLTQPNDFLVYCRNVHEIRGYNRLTLMSNAPISVTLQDDDVPGDKTWLATATKLFQVGQEENRSHTNKHVYWYRHYPTLLRRGGRGREHRILPTWGGDMSQYPID
jgi:hypothetical protein